MEEQNFQPKHRLLLPPPHHHWLRIFVIAVGVVGGFALVWFFVGGGFFAEPMPLAPTLADVEQRSVRLILRLSEGDDLAAIVMNTDGTGTYYGERGSEEHFGNLEIERQAARDVAVSWFRDGFFAIPRVIESEGGLSIEALFAVGPFEHTVACGGSCPVGLLTMAHNLWVRIPEETQDVLPAFDFSAVEVLPESGGNNGE